MRRIRTIAPPELKDSENSLESITDPVLLSHALFNLGASRQSTPYPASLRISGLHDVCVRERVLGYRDKSSTTRFDPLSLCVTFDIGHAIHEFFQNDGKYFRDRRIGWWRCLACGNVFFGKFPKTDCRNCGANREAVRYHEHAMALTSPYRVTGHMDNFMELAPGNIVVADFKTISGAGFKALTAPKGDHEIQVTSYFITLPYCQEIPIKVREDKGLLIYIAKEHQAKECPFKTFWVHKTDPIESYVRKTLQTFTEAIDDGVTVPDCHPECASSKFSNYRARNCQYVSQCK